MDKDVLRELHEHYGEDGNEGTTKAFDKLQREVNCRKRNITVVHLKQLYMCSFISSEQGPCSDERLMLKKSASQTRYIS